MIYSWATVGRSEFQVLASDGEDLWLEEVDAAGSKWENQRHWRPPIYPTNTLRKQRWRVDGKGRMVHKASNQLLALVQNGGGRVEMRSFREADREVILIEALPAVCISAEVLHPWFMAHSTCFQAWRFRCLDQTRMVDSFVQFTPWQDMLVWDWATLDTWMLSFYLLRNHAGHRWHF